MFACACSLWRHSSSLLAALRISQLDHELSGMAVLQGVRFGVPSTAGPLPAYSVHDSSTAGALDTSALIARDQKARLPVLLLVLVLLVLHIAAPLCIHL